MLLVFPSDYMTRKASDYLTTEGVAHRIIAMPERLDYDNGATTALYIESQDNMDIPMKLSRQQLVVMRVFREFNPHPNDLKPVADA